MSTDVHMGIVIGVVVTIFIMALSMGATGTQLINIHAIHMELSNFCGGFEPDAVTSDYNHIYVDCPTSAAGYSNFNVVQVRESH